MTFSEMYIWWTNSFKKETKSSTNVNFIWKIVISSFFFFLLNIFWLKISWEILIGFYTFCINFMHLTFHYSVRICHKFYVFLLPDIIV